MLVTPVSWQTHSDSWQTHSEGGFLDEGRLGIARTLNRPACLGSEVSMKPLSNHRMAV